MLGLDLGLIVHMLNVDPKAKPVAQPTRVFHTKIEEQIVKEVQKLLSNIVPMKKKNGQIRCFVDFRSSTEFAQRMSSHCQTWTY